MNRKLWMSVVMGMLAVMLVLSGCGAKKDPKEALQAAMDNAAKMKSYDFKASFILNDLNVSSPELTANPEVGMVYNMLKNAQVTVTGAYQKDPMQMEMNVDLTIKGDASFTLNMPIVLTKEKMWVKIPSIPMIPMPENLVGKFVEIDMKKLAEQAGETTVPTFDTAKSQELSMDIMKILFEKFDGKTFFQELDAKSVTLPEGVEAKQIVKLAINNENLEQGITVLAKDVVPQVLDLLASDKYKDVIPSLKAEDIAAAKKDLTDEAKLKEALAEIKKGFKINDLNVVTAVNKDQFPAYQEANINVDVTAEGSTVKVNAKVTSEYSNINGKPNFKIGTPPPDAIPMDELAQMFGGAGVGAQ
ncbi:DUF6612 family protein [Paenibacillus terrigena]|uniref:DUF6612 family protein n=1 Tax=Paenibacillus terrigena TaxID=369333 RepID=UPI000476AAF9|nr:DUF6612 family protein [Paenibacillus terrigena]